MDVESGNLETGRGHSIDGEEISRPRHQDTTTGGSEGDGEEPRKQTQSLGVRGHLRKREEPGDCNILESRKCFHFNMLHIFLYILKLSSEHISLCTYVIIS